ncbi:MAG: copper resistance protein CopC/CopD [Chloroflexi bacterium]|uniref:Copper resistance protein CopC/CopD n=1 Tax=Candidatus Chlorohelix allophototropha TaxID=3003348 RepID=A0A8T7M8S7_9CHLR|nr:copper resistance protein CopC/CopD [Chloroflexota bacterium]WJW68451.1 copper resistance protein CopC/CopD [Chloroflexota bacterium L227-S17]
MLKAGNVRLKFSIATFIGLVLLFGICRVNVANAHSGFLRSDPADGSILATAPATINIWFSEPIRLIRPGVTVFSPSGTKIEIAAPVIEGQKVTIPVKLDQNGTYRVVWQVISEDTHPVRGSFSFSVGNQSSRLAGSSAEFGAVSLLGLGLQTFSRWLHFLGYALGFFPVVFGLFALKNRTEQAEKIIWRLVNSGILLLIVAEPLALLGQSASLDESQLFDSTTIGDILASNFGRVLGQRLGAALLLWVLVSVARQGNRAASSAIILTGIVLAVANGQASHAINFGVAGLAINTFHLLAMGVWVGGLFTLIALWRLPEIASQRQYIIKRFGRLAALALLVLVTTGIASSILQTYRLENLLETNYGKTLILKLLVFVVAVLIAFAGIRANLSLRWRWWLVEGLTLASILFIVGLLVSLPVG